MISEVSERFGLVPNFFRSAAAAPGLIEQMWRFARAAYVDNPLPSLFKERLFVHLSRFCKVRYCIVRHVGFLIGEGNPAGDPAAVPNCSPRRSPCCGGRCPTRRRSTSHCAGSRHMPARPNSGASDPVGGRSVRRAGDHLSPAVRLDARGQGGPAVAGDADAELLVAFLAFVRTAHFWTETHPEIVFEPDMIVIMQRHKELSRLLLDTADARRGRPGRAAPQHLRRPGTSLSPTAHASMLVAMGDDAELPIAGGGLTGLTLGIACAGAGLDGPSSTATTRDHRSASASTAAPRRSPRARSGAAGIGIWPGRRRGRADPRNPRRRHGSPLFLHYDHRDSATTPLGFIVENRVLRRALMTARRRCRAQHMAPASVARHTSATACGSRHSRRRRSCVARARRRRRRQDSPLRRAAGIKAVELPYPQIGIVCTVRHEPPHRGVAVEHFLPAGPVRHPADDRQPLVDRVDRAGRPWRRSCWRSPDAGFTAELPARFGDFLGAVSRRAALLLPAVADAADATSRRASPSSARRRM